MSSANETPSLTYILPLFPQEKKVFAVKKEKSEREK